VNAVRQAAIPFRCCSSIRSATSASDSARRPPRGRTPSRTARSSRARWSLLHLECLSTANQVRRDRVTLATLQLLGRPLEQPHVILQRTPARAPDPSAAARPRGVRKASSTFRSGGSVSSPSQPSGRSAAFFSQPLRL